jgi:hypothetical protein
MAAEAQGTVFSPPTLPGLISNKSAPTRESAKKRWSRRTSVVTELGFSPPQATPLERQWLGDFGFSH